MRDEVGGRGAHGQKPGLEIAAGVGDLGIAVHAVEGVADFGVAGQEGDAVGEKTDRPG